VSENYKKTYIFLIAKFPRHANNQSSLRTCKSVDFCVKNEVICFLYEMRLRWSVDLEHCTPDPHGCMVLSTFAFVDLNR
jgi:hypothetical protein